MLAYKPDYEEGRLKPINSTASWLSKLKDGSGKPVTMGSHRYPSEWLEERYSWLDENGMPEAPSADLLKHAKSVAEWEELEYCAPSEDLTTRVAGQEHIQYHLSIEDLGELKLQGIDAEDMIKCADFQVHPTLRRQNKDLEAMKLDESARSEAKDLHRKASKRIARKLSHNVLKNQKPSEAQRALAKAGVSREEALANMVPGCKKKLTPAQLKKNQKKKGGAGKIKKKNALKSKKKQDLKKLAFKKITKIALKEKVKAMEAQKIVGKKLRVVLETPLGKERYGFEGNCHAHDPHLKTVSFLHPSAGKFSVPLESTSETAAFEPFRKGLSFRQLKKETMAEWALELHFNENMPLSESSSLVEELTGVKPVQVSSEHINASLAFLRWSLGISHEVRFLDPHLVHNWLACREAASELPQAEFTQKKLEKAFFLFFINLCCAVYMHNTHVCCVYTQHTCM